MPISLQSDVTNSVIMAFSFLFYKNKVTTRISLCLMLEKGVNDYVQCLQICNETGTLLNCYLHCKLKKGLGKTT